MDDSLTLLDLAPGAATARIASWAHDRGLPSYRVEQIARRLWQAPVKEWQDATELPGALREQLSQEFPLPRLSASVTQQSQDGTRKYLWTLPDG